MLSNQKLSYTLDEAQAATGMSRSRIFSAIQSGDLRSFKDGKRRMVSVKSLKDFIDKLERSAA